MIDLAFGEALPAGVRSLGEILRSGFLGGTVQPFRTELRDQSGQLRSDGSRDLSPEQIMHMDWLCDNVEGEIPAFEKLLPMSRETVRLLGVYRDRIPPEKEGARL